jgi:hypothetical protein
MTSARRTLLAVVFAAALVPGPARAQLDLQNAIGDVLDWIKVYQDNYEAIPESGAWGLLFGWFAEGEEKAFTFDVTAGKSYVVAGGGDNNAKDLDICVYDAKGSRVNCDEETDDVPLVLFDATMTGRYRAVLKAYSLSETSFAGMVVLRKKG